MKKIASLFIFLNLFASCKTDDNRSSSNEPPVSGMIFNQSITLKHGRAFVGTLYMQDHETINIFLTPSDLDCDVTDVEGPVRITVPARAGKYTIENDGEVFYENTLEYRMEPVTDFEVEIFSVTSNRVKGKVFAGSSEGNDNNISGAFDIKICPRRI